MRMTRTRTRGLLGLLLSLALPAAGAAQDPAAAGAPADVGTPDAIIAALYDVISGPAGQARDWDRFRSLFLPGARLIPIRVSDGGERGIRVMTPEDFIEASGPILLERGFYEREIGRTSDAFGHMLHVFSAYDSRRTPDGPVFARGINSIQLWDDGTRWWIATVMWDSERPDNPIPTRFLSER